MYLPNLMSLSLSIIQKYLTLLLHQAKTNIYTPHHGRISNAYHMEHLNNLVKMSSEFKIQPDDQAIMNIATEEKYPGGSYEIIDQY